jgi:hypothetical protein
MNPPTVIIANLIPRLRETVAQHLKAYLGGEGELSSILESIEFWYDRIRDKEHPDLPMWSDLSSRDSDQLFDAWIEAVEEFFRQRLALPVSSHAEASLQVTGSDCVTLPRVVVEEVEKTLGTAFSFVDGFSGPKSEKLNKAISSALSSLRASLKPQA